jgi:hypothetical protein
MFYTKRGIGIFAKEPELGILKILGEALEKLKALEKV